VLQKLIQQWKIQMGSDYLQSLRGDAMWRAAQYANPTAGMTVEAITDSEGKQANTATEKEEMLTCESFPLHINDQNYDLPPTAAHTHRTLSKRSSGHYILNQSK
jgi:hypothetical protein